MDNLITRNDAYGKQEEIYNGVDVNFQVRLLGRATLGGGWNIGNAVQLGTAAGGSASAGTDTCYVIDSPQQLFNCKVDVPYQNRVKLNGSYTFPYGIQVAAVFQSNPGANYGANRTYTLAEIQPSLGRPLSGGLTTVVIPLVTPLSVFGPRINQFDLRGTKILRIGDVADPAQRRCVQSVQQQHAGHAVRHLQCAVGTADAGARRAAREVQRADRLLARLKAVNAAGFQPPTSPSTLCGNWSAGRLAS